MVHKITDFINNPIGIDPTSKAKRGKHEIMNAKYNLKGFTSIDEAERTRLIDFVEGFEDLNTKLIKGTYNKLDIENFQAVVELYKNKLDGCNSIPESFSTLRFDNKRAAFEWLNFNMNFKGKESEVVDFELKQNLLVFKSVAEARQYYALSDYNGDKTYGGDCQTESVYKNDDYLLNIRFIGVHGCKNFTKTENYIVFAGTQLSVDMTNLVIDKNANGNESTILVLGTAQIVSEEEMVHLNQSVKGRKIKAGAKKVGKAALTGVKKAGNYLNYIAED